MLASARMWREGALLAGIGFLLISFLPIISAGFFLDVTAASAREAPDLLEKGASVRLRLELHRPEAQSAGPEGPSWGLRQQLELAMAARTLSASAVSVAPAGADGLSPGVPGALGRSAPLLTLRLGLEGVSGLAGSPPSVGVQGLAACLHWQGQAALEALYRVSPQLRVGGSFRLVEPSASRPDGWAGLLQLRSALGLEVQALAIEGVHAPAFGSARVVALSGAFGSGRLSAEAAWVALEVLPEEGAGAEEPPARREVAALEGRVADPQGRWSLGGGAALLAEQPPAGRLWTAPAFLLRAGWDRPGLRLRGEAWRFAEGFRSPLAERNPRPAGTSGLELQLRADLSPVLRLDGSWNHRLPAGSSRSSSRGRFEMGLRYQAGRGRWVRVAVSATGQEPETRLGAGQEAWSWALVPSIEATWGQVEGRWSVTGLQLGPPANHGVEQEAQLRWEPVSGLELTAGGLLGETRALRVGLGLEGPGKVQLRLVVKRLWLHEPLAPEVPAAAPVATRDHLYGELLWEPAQLTRMGARWGHWDRGRLDALWDAPQDLLIFVETGLPGELEQ